MLARMILIQGVIYLTYDFMQGVEFSHFLCEKHIAKGALVVDATAGNGYDTVFLAKLVGPEGRVYAFDIQQKAIDNTKSKLERNGISDRVVLIKDGHQNLLNYVRNNIDGVLFNLGYLPGGDKKVVTKKETTFKALRDSINILKKGGIIVLVIYTGHPGGQNEYNVVLDYSKNLDSRIFNVVHYNFINQKNPPAQVFGIIKR